MRPFSLHLKTLILSDRIYVSRSTAKGPDSDVGMCRTGAQHGTDVRFTEQKTSPRLAMDS